MYAISYCKYGLPQVDLTFKTESAMFAYVQTWINGDEDWINYYRDDEPYDPAWTL